MDAELFVGVIREHPIRVIFWVWPNKSEVGALHPVGWGMLTRGCGPHNLPCS